METETNESTLVGICNGCKRLIFASVMDEESKKRNANRAAQLIRKGHIVEVWGDVERVRTGNWGCKCEAGQR